MNPYLRSLVLALAGLSALLSVRAADTPAAPAAPAAPAIEPAEKTPILAAAEKQVTVIAEKLKAANGALKADQLAEDLARFDAIVTEFPDASAKEKADVVWIKAYLYLNVFEDLTKGADVVRQIKAEYPTTEYATKADELLAAIEQDRKMQELRNSLVEGAVFPGLEGKALDGTTVSTAALKGKVVLVDFWATWCPPCREELPNMLAAYEKFHAKGFEVLAVSLDRDETELKNFIAAQKLPWPQIFEGAAEIADKFGIEAIPTTYLIDGDGKIAARNLRGDQLEKRLEIMLATK